MPVGFANKLLITIPYVKVSNPDFDKYFYMPGLYNGDSVVFNYKMLEKFNNISSKNYFDSDGSHEPIILFLQVVYQGLEQFRDLKPNIHYPESVYSSKKFNQLSDDIYNQLVDLNKIPNLKKPKLRFG